MLKLVILLLYVILIGQIVGIKMPSKAPDRKFCVEKSKKVRTSIDKLSERVSSLLQARNCDTRMAMEVKINSATKGFKWVSVSPTDGPLDVPDNAVYIGRENITAIYVCRALVEESFLPGKYLPANKTCIVPYRGKEVPVTLLDNIEILSAERISWSKSNVNVTSLHVRALHGGFILDDKVHEIFSPLFIARTTLEMGAVTGYVHPGSKELFYPYKGDVQRAQTYEVLLNAVRDKVNSNT